MKKEKILTLLLLIASTLAAFLYTVKFDFSFDLLSLSLGIMSCCVGLFISYFMIQGLNRLQARPKSKVFIAYSIDDSKFVEGLTEQLAKSRIYVLNESSEHHLGLDLFKIAKDELNHVDYVLVVVSKNMAKDKLLNRIISLSKSKAKKIIPIVIDKSELPKSIANYFSLDTSEDKNISDTTEHIVERLVHAL